MGKIFNLLFGEPVWKKYAGILDKYPAFQELLRKGKAKVPKSLKGIENKHMLKKALREAFKAKGIPIKNILVKEDKKYYYVSVKF